MEEIKIFSVGDVLVAPNKCNNTFTAGKQYKVDRVHDSHVVIFDNRNRMRAISINNISLFQDDYKWKLLI
jgi:hypothetical protein